VTAFSTLTSRVVKTIKVGARPIAMAITPDGKWTILDRNETLVPATPPRHDTARYDTARYDTARYDTARYDAAPDSALSLGPYARGSWRCPVLRTQFSGDGPGCLVRGAGPGAWPWCRPWCAVAAGRRNQRACVV
jgi:hypothetical protein